MLGDPTAETLTFTPDIAGTYQIEFRFVSDGIEDSEIASVTVVATTAQGELVEALESAIDEVNALDTTRATSSRTRAFKRTWPSTSRRHLPTWTTVS